MNIGKKVSSSAALYGEGKGLAPDIEMPPLDYQLGGSSYFQGAQQPTATHNETVQSDSGREEMSQTEQAFSVPEYVPEDVLEEMNKSQDASYADDSSVESAKPLQKQMVQESFNSKEHNLKELRLAKEKAEKERDTLMAQMLEMYQGKNAKGLEKVVQPTIEEEIDFSIDEDALVEGKYVKKVVAELKNLKKQIKNQHSQSQEAVVEAKIKSQFPDFEKVVSQENVELLNAQFPEVASSLRDTQDMYSKAAAAYKIMKTFGIYKDVYEEDRMKAIKNSQKPRPLTSVSPQQGDSPLSKANAFANGFTPELKEQLRKEMMEARRRG